MGFQKHKWWGLLLLLVPLAGHISCSAAATVPLKTEFDYSVINNVRRHTVGIAVYYTMSETEYNKRMERQTTQKWSMDGTGFRIWKQLIVPVKVVTPQGIQTPIKCLAYIGAGTVIGKSHILSVRHLFGHTENSFTMTIWVFLEGLDHPIQADIEVLSTGKVECDDYALLKSKEDLGAVLPGLRIAARDSARIGDRVIFTGSPGGIGFFTRFGYLTKFDWFFQVDEDGALHLKSFENFPFWCVHPGAPGDSGGNIVNLRGEIIGVMYCGLTVYTLGPVFSNPTGFIHDFLVGAGHGDLLK